MLDFWSLCVGLFSLLIIRFVLSGRKKSTDKLAPGPWRLPGLGHLHLLGTVPQMNLLELKKTYGPIMSIDFGSFPCVVLHDAKLMREAFNIAALSGRPKIKPFVVGCEDKGLAFADGPAVPEQRQFAIRNLKDFGLGSKSMEDQMRDEIVEFLEVLKAKSGQVVTVNRLFSSYVVNALWSIVMGEKFKDQAEVDHLAHLVTTRISRSDTMLSKLALFLPWLADLMPNWSGYNDKVGAFQEIYAFAKSRIAHHKLTWVKDQPRDLTDAYLDKIAETTDVNSSFHASRDYQPMTTGDLFMGGVETSTTSLEWLTNLMARHPQVQRKLQAEIDQVIGNSRLPSLSDRSEMPYTEAVIFELLRTNSALPLTLFHRAYEDVEFHGYKIPKNTSVIGNIYGCHNDPEVWTEPEKFWPERFIDPDGKLIRNENLISFSYGRRVCPGERMARDQLFLYTAAIFQRFSVEFPPNAPHVRGYFGLTWTPEIFQAIFTERNV